MIRLKSRNHCPVGGFIVGVPELGAPSRTWWDFKTAGDKLWDLLKGNPATLKQHPSLPQSREACDEFIDAQNAQRMVAMGAMGYVSNVEVMPPKLTAPEHSLFARSVVAGGKIASGAAIIKSMFGSDGPCERDEAERRAAICADCKFNEKGDFLSLFTAPAAAVIRNALGVVHDMKLITSKDNDLQFCSLCLCPLKTKVHARIEHIHKHLPSETRETLPDWCWSK